MGCVERACCTRVYETGFILLCCMHAHTHVWQWHGLCFVAIRATAELSREWVTSGAVVDRVFTDDILHRHAGDSVRTVVAEKTLIGRPGIYHIFGGPPWRREGANANTG